MIHLITLGVQDLNKSKNFYTDLFKIPPAQSSNDHIVFFDLPCAKLALYSREALAEDAKVSTNGSGFKGITLAFLVRNKSDVDIFLAKAESLGAKITKPAQDVFWGGHSGYFQDFDKHLWEIAWNPFFPFNLNGSVSIP